LLSCRVMRILWYKLTMERTKDNLIEMDSNLHENIRINCMDSTRICDCIYFYGTGKEVTHARRI